ncbi:hypothetical protein BH10ACT1_BH10ACT1_39700 [soil metagenome]
MGDAVHATVTRRQRGIDGAAAPGTLSGVTASDDLATTAAQPLVDVVDVMGAVRQVVRSRRTSLLVDRERPVPDDLVDQLIEAATWAPNHKRTWPWRFTVVTGGSRARLGEAMADHAQGSGAPEAKVAKLRTKYLRSPTLLLVWQAVDVDDEVRRREDRDAVAAAVQNLLLVATAHGLGSYWGTVADHLVPAVRAVAGVDRAHDLVALVYLGWPTAAVPAPARTVPEVTRLR